MSGVVEYVCKHIIKNTLCPPQSKKERAELTKQAKSKCTWVAEASDRAIIPILYFKEKSNTCVSFVTLKDFGFQFYIPAVLAQLTHITESIVHK